MVANVASGVPAQQATEATDSSPKLKTSNVNFFYGRYQALHDVSLNVTANQITALIGPSGCGKSTFLRVLNRMHETVRGGRVEGRVLLEGEDAFAMDVTSLRRRVGMVFQKPNPFPKTIFNNVAYGLQVNGLHSRPALADAVESSLKLAALWDEVKDQLHQSAYALSGGQQQRVAVARALAGDPSILLADEPTGNLDSQNGEQVMDLLRELHRGGATICMVTHDPRYARYADRSIHLFDGRVVEENMEVPV